LLLVFAAILNAQSIMNSYIGLNTNDNSFAFNMGTCAACSPAGANLLYYYAGGLVTSHMVVKVNNKAYDLVDTANCPVIGSVQNGGTYINGIKRVANLVYVNVLWQFVDNPATGSPADTAMFRFILTNMSSSPVNVALRLMLDTMVINNDGTNISVDNGFSVISQDTVWYKSMGQIPPSWWDFDVNPTIGTPSLVGRGYTYGNITGAAATEPDIMEVANWVDVSGTAQWALAPAGKDMAAYHDSSVVLWWCNGSPASSGFTLAPGNSITFLTYYGLNQEQMLTTPTITPTITQSYTVTPTRTITNTITFTPTRTHTLTATDSATLTPTNTSSATVTHTPTCSITETSTATPSFTCTYSPTVTQSITGTFTHTRTVTPTPSFTASSSASPTATASPTISKTGTPTLTHTASPAVTATVTKTCTDTPTFTNTVTESLTPSLTLTVTYTALVSFTPTVTATGTPTNTATKTIFCFELKGAFPNPFHADTNIAYLVCKDSEVEAVIYTVSGEIVRRLYQHAVSGWNALYWDGKNNAGRNAASGVFIYSIEAVSGSDRKKLWGKVAELK
jgi:hypothetical protein